MAASPTAPELCRLHLDTGFVRDADGRLLGVNEQSVVNAVPRPPLVCLLRSSEGNLWAVRADVDDLLRHALDQLLRREPVGPVGDAPPRCRDAMLRLMADHAPLTHEASGPLFAVLEPYETDTDVVAIERSSQELLLPHYPDILADFAFSEPCVAKLDNSDHGGALSVCFSARRGAEADAAGVVTVPKARGRGHATAVTGGWAQLVRAEGKVPLYGTDWENHASRAVARRLGARLFASEWSLTDVPPRAKNHP